MAGILTTLDTLLTAARPILLPLGGILRILAICTGGMAWLIWRTTR